MNNFSCKLQQSDLKKSLFLAKAELFPPLPPIAALPSPLETSVFEESTLPPPPPAQTPHSHPLTPGQRSVSSREVCRHEQNYICITQMHMLTIPSFKACSHIFHNQCLLKQTSHLAPHWRITTFRWQLVLCCTMVVKNHLLNTLQM